MSATCFALFLIMYTTTASAATVYSTIFDDGVSSGGTAYIVTDLGEVTGVYFDYAADGGVTAENLLSSSTVDIGSSAAYDVYSTQIFGSDVEFISGGQFLLINSIDRDAAQSQTGGIGDSAVCTDIECFIINGFFNPKGDFARALIYESYFEFEATSVVPIPAAAWLFGTGLLGLIGVARRKSHA